MIIYKVTNAINGRVYIGQTVMSLARRWSQHSTSKKNSPMYNAFRKYGAENFKIEAICTALAPEYLNGLEQYFISYYNSLAPNGYNLTSGGDSAFVRSDYTKEMQRLAMTGKIVSDETKAKIAASLTGRPGHRRGAKHSEESRRLISEKQTGRKLSDETKAKMKEAKLNKKCYNSRQVQCLETGEIFISTSAAARSLNLDQTSVAAVCRGARNTTGGYTFKYL